MKKNILLGLVLISTLASGLFGCGNKESKDSKKDGVTNLSWYISGPPQKDMEMVNKKLNTYLKKEYKLTVDIKMIDLGDYEQKMNTLVNSGEKIDLMFTSPLNFDYLINARKGSFLNIKNYLKKDEFKKLNDSVGETSLKGADIDGKLFGIPTRGGVKSYAYYYVFNKKYINKYDIDYQKIKTIDDLATSFKTVKEKEGITPWYMEKATLHPTNFDELSFPLGIDLKGDSKKIVSIFETPEYLESMDAVYQYKKEGYINKDAITVDPSTLKDDLRTKEWFMTTMGMTPMDLPLANKQVQGEVVIQQAGPALVNNNQAAGNLVAVGAQSEHPKEAVEFLQALNTDPKVLNMLTYGIEGVHYKLNDNNEVTLTKKADDYIVQGYNFGADGSIAYTRSDALPNRKQLTEDFNKLVIESPALGFHFDTTPVQTEIAAINNVTSEFTEVLNTGSAEPKKELVAMQKKLEAAGIKKVQKEMQSQYDKWIKI